MDVKEILQQIQKGTLSVEEGEALFAKLSYESLGDFAKIDHNRKVRNGFPEVIYCCGKSTEHLVEIYESFYRKGEDVLGTRGTELQFLEVKKRVPTVAFDSISGILKIHEKPLPLKGTIAICSGGTSDLFVAEEAALTAEFFGHKVKRYYDVGVAGIHRLFTNLEEIREANCIISVAGMEGALSGVLAGLVDKPIISVPTSVGYGANFQGLAPLLTMLNSCAEGISVVNIDNGFGAAYCACQINLLALK